MIFPTYSSNLEFLEKANTIQEMCLGVQSLKSTACPAKQLFFFQKFLANFLSTKSQRISQTFVFFWVSFWGIPDLAQHTNARCFILIREAKFKRALRVHFLTHFTKNFCHFLTTKVKSGTDMINPSIESSDFLFWHEKI